MENWIPSLLFLLAVIFFCNAKKGLWVAKRGGRAGEENCGGNGSLVFLWKAPGDAEKKKNCWERSGEDQKILVKKQTIEYIREEEKSRLFEKKRGGDWIEARKGRRKSAMQVTIIIPVSLRKHWEREDDRALANKGRKLSGRKEKTGPEKGGESVAIGFRIAREKETIMS